MTYNHVQTTINELLTGHTPLSTVSCRWTRMFRLLLVERHEGRVPAQAFRRRSDELFICQRLYHAYGKLLRRGWLIRNPSRLPRSLARLSESANRPPDQKETFQGDKKKNTNGKKKKKNTHEAKKKKKSPRDRKHYTREERKIARKQQKKGKCKRGKLVIAADWYKENTVDSLRVALNKWVDGWKRAQMMPPRPKPKRQPKHAIVKDKFTQQRLTSFFGGSS